MRGMNNWELRGPWLIAGCATCLALAGCGGTEQNGGPALIPITTCNETFTACGGDPTGTWQYTSGCTTPDPATVANQGIAAQFPACAGIFTGMTASLGGSVTLQGGTYSQTESAASTYHATLNATCFTALTTASLSASTCTQYQSNLNAISGTSATCSYNGSTCNCDYSVSRQATESGTYSISGSTLTSTSVDAGVSQTTSADFCVQGNNMTLQDVSNSGGVGISHFVKK